MTDRINPQGTSAPEMDSAPLLIWAQATTVNKYHTRGGETHNNNNNNNNNLVTSVKNQSNLENTWTKEGCSKLFKIHSEKLLDYRGLIILYM